MALFTAKIDEGAHRSTVAFSAGGSSTTSVTVIVDKAKITEKKGLIDCLKDMITRIEEADYPPA